MLSQFREEAEPLEENQVKRWANFQWPDFSDRDVKSFKYDMT